MDETLPTSSLPNKGVLDSLNFPLINHFFFFKKRGTSEDLSGGIRKIERRPCRIHTCLELPLQEN